MARLVDAETGQLLLSKLEFADTFWRRLKGLQFDRHLASDCGLWLRPCSSIHTCFMWFPIDVVMLDRQMTVLDVRQGVRPWRIVGCPKRTHSIIESNANSVAWIVGRAVAVQTEKPR